MSVLFAILLFSLMILVHELGHFTTAKLSGVQVNEFSLFMGPALWKKQVGETLYAIRTIPFGGYCAMEGEEDNSENPRSFQKAVWWKRVLILAAGAAMNFALGVLLMFLVYLPAQQVVEPVITSFESYSTVDGTDGLQVGDKILKLDGEKIYVQSDFSLVLGLNPGEYHDLVVLRDGKKVEIPNLHMERHPVASEDGTTQMLFGMNFTLKELNLADKLQYAWLQSLDAVRMVRFSFEMLFSGKAGLSEVSSPIGIVQQMSTVAEASPTALDAVLNLLYFAGFITINLAIMNLLPIPALDGGRVVGVLLTTAVEKFIGRKIDPKYEGYLHGAGMAVLLGLMAVVMLKDIFVLFRG